MEMWHSSRLLPRVPNPSWYTVLTSAIHLPMNPRYLRCVPQPLNPSRLILTLQDALKSRKPDPGATAGRGRAGRIGATGGTLLTQHLLKTRGKLVSTDAELDPREAILRHADKEDDISMLTAAYAKTQPQPVFAEPEPEEDEDE